MQKLKLDPTKTNLFLNTKKSRQVIGYVQFWNGNAGSLKLDFGDVNVLKDCILKYLPPQLRFFAFRWPMYLR